MINSIINKVEEGMKHHLTDKGIEKLRITLRYALSDFVIKEAETSAEDVQTTNEQLIQGFALAKGIEGLSSRSLQNTVTAPARPSPPATPQAMTSPPRAPRR